MNCFIVSSTLTFVPENYQAFTNSMAEDVNVRGLILIENRNLAFLMKAIALILTLAAPRFGWQLLKNFFDGSTTRKRKAFECVGKKFYLVKDINSIEALEIIKREQIDVLLNARTRAFFKKKLLAAPRIGCINIHHGLLPDQRGLMCDFWAHYHKTLFGFSIHQMTSKLDDGPVLKAHQIQMPALSTTQDIHKNYLKSIFAGSQQEAPVAKEILHKIALDKAIIGTPNLKTENTVYRTNPTFRDLYRLQLRGTKI